MPGQRVHSPPAETSLLAWLLTALQPMSRTRVKELLQQGRITVNGVPITRFNHLVHPNDQIDIDTERPNALDPVAAGIPLVFADDQLLIVDKAAGLLSVATEAERDHTAFARLNAYLQERRMGRPYVVHRLDRETSGLLLFARSAVVRDHLQASWPQVAKTYLAVVEGLPRPDQGVVQNYLTEGRDLRVRASRSSSEGKWAVTHYQVVSTHDRFTLLEVSLETGRKHQIRVHLSGLGCPIIGDKVYGATTNPAGRLGLHAWRLRLDHPTTGVRLELEAPLPDVLRRVVALRT